MESFTFLAAKPTYLVGAVSLEYPTDNWRFASGSISGSISNDFYSWDPSSLAWVNLSNTPNTPSPRQNVGMACVTGRLYVFGGDNGSSVMNELYEYNILLREWNVINISDSGPTERAGHGFASAHGNLYVFGGRDLHGDFWYLLSRIVVSIDSQKLLCRLFEKWSVAAGSCDIHVEQTKQWARYLDWAAARTLRPRIHKSAGFLNHIWGAEWIRLY